MLHNKIGSWFDNVVVGDVGIEHEFEFKEPLYDDDFEADNFDSKVWQRVGEGSLRNGWEYVLRTPLKIRQLPAAYQELQKKVDFDTIQNSIRTSTHIHVNVRQLTPYQIFVFLVLYWTIERTLVRMNGNFREGNLFCLRSSDAEAIVDAAIKEYHNFDLFNAFFEFKYSALNLIPIRRFGSVEYRFLKMITEPVEAIRWCDNLVRLTNAATKFRTPQAALSELEKDTASVFRDIFTPPFYREIVRVTPDLQGELHEMLSLLRLYVAEMRSTTKARRAADRFVLNSEESDELPVVDIEKET